MKMIFLMLATLTMTSANAALPALKVVPRIVGGVEVDAKTDASFIVSIGGGCAGSIIDAKWILTAAHCKPLFTRAVTGGSTSLYASDRVKLKVLKSYVHPEYSSSKSSNDFALLELATPIDFENTKLSKIEMADSNLETSGGLEEGTVATVLGWGVTRENGSQPSVMRMVDVPLVSRERANAREAYNGAINESMIAAGYDQGGKDSCQGDSGGPLIVKDEVSKKQTLIGVVSFGEGCARAKKYGIYSNVAYGQEWIQKVINK
ncbi:serine protease [Bacteriovorax stolpii]|uniref:Trypsin n=1 Tax=Bacteriovorax stolpii TaxID=960 RepID=A0A2K9NTR1_BACTC|nr:serine protease [Bacteriovorax stolpii]AUN98916.1 trypsin [Bacteriovorax stolpii]QDK41088.1 serine protease [Bacteriovorax stolpii]TDP55558.1 trypsin [Bacteriovorax stolpii]BDT29072.1 serine protease [Bacteriovorax sp. HI3]